jgi:hypothetical protein
LPGLFNLLLFTTSPLGFRQFNLSAKCLPSKLGALKDVGMLPSRNFQCFLMQLLLLCIDAVEFFFEAAVRVDYDTGELFNELAGGTVE